MVAFRLTLTSPKPVKPDVVARSLVLPDLLSLAASRAALDRSIIRCSTSPLISPLTFMVVLSSELWMTAGDRRSAIGPSERPRARRPARQKASALPRAGLQNLKKETRNVATRGN